MSSFWNPLCMWLPGHHSVSFLPATPATSQLFGLVSLLPPELLIWSAPKSRFWTGFFLIPLVISPTLMALKCHLKQLTPNISLAQKFLLRSKLLYPTGYLTSPLGCLIGNSNISKLSFRFYVVNAMPHCPHPPSGIHPATSWQSP